MTEPAAPLITAIAALVAAVTSLLGVVISLMNSRRIEQNSHRIDLVHKATNGVKDELVREVRAAALAKGIKQGEAIAKADHA